VDNRDEFIREIALRIGSSLEIKESLRSAFEYLREHVPLDMLALFILDERLGAIRHIAHAFEDSAVPPNEIIPLPEGMAEKIAARNYSTPFVVDAGEDEIFRTLSPLVGLEGYTDLIVPLRIRGELLGGLALRAREEERYSEEHAELLGRIGTPFAVVFANTSPTRRCSVTRPYC
jgi:GAF domain-containing protein